MITQKMFFLNYPDYPKPDKLPQSVKVVVVSEDLDEQDLQGTELCVFKMEELMYWTVLVGLFEDYY